MTKKKTDTETTSADDNIKTNNSEEKQKTFFQKIWNYLISIKFNILEILPNKSSKIFAYIALLLSSLLFISCSLDRFLHLYYLFTVYLIYLMLVNNFYFLSFIIPIIFTLSRFNDFSYTFDEYSVIIALPQILLYISLIALLISLFCKNKHRDMNTNQNSKKTPPSNITLILITVGKCLMFCIYVYFACYMVLREYVYEANNRLNPWLVHRPGILWGNRCNSFLPKKEEKCNQNCNGVMKPIIYLYPENKTEASVELGNAYKISHSYPKYEKEWNVVVDSNSNILYNGRNYYGLYWEGKGSVNFDMNDGFVVKGSDSAKFLEEKLSILGLNEREANEFIIYWLPKLENNAYNFIKFASIEAQNEYMPLSISPKPDTVIRVLMGYKGLNKKIEVKEQILPPKPERNGFVAVEWGGTEIGDNVVY